MAVSGVPERIFNHGKRVAEMAFAMLNSVIGMRDPSNPTDYIKIRIGKTKITSKYCLGLSIDARLIDLWSRSS